jgi:hypothetical protein
MFVCSYSDPNLSETLNVYDEIANHLRNLEIDSDGMKRLIIGTLSDLDEPKSPSAMAAVALDNYFKGYSDTAEQEIREQVLNTTVDDLRNLAPLFDELKNNGVVACVGSESKINSESYLFDSVESPAKSSKKEGN